GKGVITIKATERNGKVVGLRIVTDEDDLMLITDRGKLIRMPADGIPTIGRNTQGVRLIRLEEDEVVVAMERMAEREEGAERELSPEVAAARAEEQTLAEEDLGEEAAVEDEEEEEDEGEGEDEGDHVRPAAGPRLHRPQQAHQGRRRLPRSRRHAARGRRLRRRDAGDPWLGGGDRSGGRRHGDRPLQRRGGDGGGAGAPPWRC